MINIELDDLLVFEDGAGNTYRDIVDDISYENFNPTQYIDCNRFDLYNNDTGCYISDKLCDADGKLDLKEIWHKIDEDTYKKVAELVDGELTHISYINGTKFYHKRMAVTEDQFKTLNVDFGKRMPEYLNEDK